MKQVIGSIQGCVQVHIQVQNRGGDSAALSILVNFGVALVEIFLLGGDLFCLEAGYRALQSGECGRSVSTPLKTMQTLQDRAKKAAEIIATPHQYKVCEGCDSIVAERVATCPNCYGYRFDDSVEAVTAQATVLGSREQKTVTAQDLLL